MRRLTHGPGRRKTRFMTITTDEELEALKAIGRVCAIARDNAADAAIPTIRLAVETMPSLAPSTAARSQPIRSTAWRSVCR